MNTNLNIVVWGLGSHAINKILPAINRTEGLKLYGVCSRNKEVVDNYAKIWECHSWTNPVLMLEDSSIDVVYLSTPISLHAQQTKNILNANKHVWCEKPFTTTFIDAKNLVNLSRKKNLSVCEGYMFLYHPQFKAIYHQLEEKKLGEIISINCRFGIPYLTNPGFRNNQQLGGGAFFDVGCYPLITLIMLFPKEELKVLFASISKQNNKSVDTKGFAVISLTNGITAYVEWGIDVSYRNEINIWGTQKSLFSDRIFSKDSVYLPSLDIRDTKGDKENNIPIDSADHFSEMLKYFVEVTLDSEKSEIERDLILKRAKLLHGVFSSSVILNQS